MPNIIKKWVSKNKRRYQQEGFNLDLAYISGRLIAMGFPADSIEGVYRNHVDDVQRFLEQKHENHYKIYNLCQEKEYNPSKFKGSVMRFPFEDHNPPPFEMMKAFCEDVKKWLDLHDHNVAVIHCKAGKGRTGLMICAYLVYAYGYTTIDALSYYANERTKDSKGVTIPSQRRYVQYFEGHLKEPQSYKPITLRLKAIKLSSVPHISASSYCNFIISVRHLHLPDKTISEVFGPAKKGETDVLLCSEFFQPKLCKDFRIDVYNKSLFANKVNLFHFWLNASFVHEMASKSQISALHELKTQHQLHLNNFNNDPLDKENSFNDIHSNGFENGLDVNDKSNKNNYAAKSEQDRIKCDEFVISSTKDNDTFDAATYYENCIDSNTDDVNMSDNKKIKINNSTIHKNIELTGYSDGSTHGELMYSSLTPDNAIRNNDLYEEDIKKKCQKYDDNKNKFEKTNTNHDINSNKNIGINHTTNLKIMNALKREIVSKANARSMNTLQNTLNDEGSRQVLISYKKMEESGSSSSASKMGSPLVGRGSDDVFIYKNTEKIDEVQDFENHKEKIDTSNHFINTRAPNNALQKDIHFKKTKSPSADLRSKEFLTLILKKSELDKAVKDKQNRIFPEDFAVTLYFSECDPRENNTTATVNHYGLEESDDHAEFVVRHSV